MRPFTTFALVVLSALPATVLAEDRPGAWTRPRKLCDLSITRDVDYCHILGDPDLYRHRLDVFRPKNAEGCPVLFFVHGGGWMSGWKEDVFGIYGYGTIAESFARRGIVVVLPNYRLSPGVRHPEHVKDIARAFAWTCENVRKYGGDPARIVVGGHSAGGHLVSLLVTDETYLKAEGRSAKDIRGVAAVSGVYCLNDLACEWRFGGPEKEESFNLRASLFYPVFGADPDDLKRASPISYVRPGLPPFLLLNGGLDYYPLRGMTRQFAAELKKNGCEVRTRVLPWRTHETALFDVARLDSDATTRALILDFVEEVAGGH